MDAIETEGRANAVRHARLWKGTRYHNNADVLGGGVDCGMLLVRTFVDTGLIPAFDPRPYPADWMLHNDGERYLDIVRHVAPHEYDPRAIAPLPADIIVWRWGRTFSHGAIVTAWPRVVHAYLPAGMVEEIDVTGTPLMRMGAEARPMKAFSLWRVPAMNTAD